jgi:membrane-associated phospholipid phosphatase
MGLTLIATGEHYFFDVVLGWIYAGAAMTGWAWWERRRAERSVAGPLAAD